MFNGTRWWYLVLCNQILTNVYKNASGNTDVKAGTVDAVINDGFQIATYTLLVLGYVAVWVV
jgi:hypothetical protein